MRITENLSLNKIELTDSPVDITVINPNWDTLDTIIQRLMTEKVDLVIGKGLSTEDFTTLEKDKLRDIEVGANKYVHPETHDANIITGLHTIATSGSYVDLIDKPLTFSPSEHTHDDRYYTETEIDSKIGALSDFTTATKTDLVSAINENKDSISTNTQQVKVCFKPKGDLTGSANALIENGVGRDVGGMTEIPAEFSNIINFNSDIGNGNYIIQLCANNNYIGYRFGSDNNLSNSTWLQMATVIQVQAMIDANNA